MQFSDIVASLKLAAQNARNNVNARRAGSINKHFAGVPVPDRASNVQFIRGASLVDGGQFNPAAIDLNGGLLVVGGMGTGKTNTAMAVAAMLASNGESFVSYNMGGGYVSRFYRTGDHLLNPYDDRGEHYNIFADLDKNTGLYHFARAFFPASAHPNSLPAYHRNAAHALVQELAELTVAGACTNEAFCTFLYDTPVEQLVDLLAGTSAADVLTAAAGAEILAIARETMRSLRDLKSGNFSLSEALSKPDTRVFITSTAEHQAQLAPLNTFLLGRVCQMCVQGPRLRNPLPVITDEFGTLSNAPVELKEATQERMIRLVLCVQSLDQLTRKFGAERAKELRNDMRNTLVFRCQDASADAVAQSMGSAWGYSFVRDSDRDGSGGGYHRKAAQALVLPEEIRRLPDNTGYLQVAGSGQVAKVTVPYTPTDKIAEPFVLREDLWIEMLSIFVPAFAEMAKALEAPIALQAELAANGDAMAALKVAAAKALQADLANIQAIPRERASRLMAVLSPRKSMDAALNAGLTAYATEAFDTFFGRAMGK